MTVESKEPMTLPSEPAFSSDCLVVIVGAGFSGLATAIKLQNSGFHNFLILEKESDVGGTWRDNSYPGCISDLPIHLYSLSTDLRTHWESSRATAPEILAYIKDIVRSHNLDSHIRLDTKVTQARWDSSAQSYSVTTENSRTGRKDIIDAKILVSATGILHVPRLPKIPGMGLFSGAAFHSAQWDHTIDLTGKRVAVIGNGSTGAGLMSTLPKMPGIKVTNFYRTPNWFLPAGSPPVPHFLRWLAKSLPVVTRLHRWLLYWFMELVYLLSVSTLVREPLRKAAAASMKSVAPAKYHADLIPEFPVGSRRIVSDTGYLENLGLSNVDAKKDVISEIYSDGIITNDGEKLPFDVIIYATGFVVDRYHTNIIRKDCLSVQDYYDQTGGPNAYLGTTLPGFPNFIMLTGPNTATGYTSVNLFAECQLHYASILMRPILNGTASTFEVKKQATSEYNQMIQKRLEGMSFKHAAGWYKSKQTGKNIAIFPGSTTTFWRWTYTADWTHYMVSGLKPEEIKLPNGGEFFPSTAVVMGMGLICVTLCATRIFV